MPCNYKEYPENWRWLSKQIVADAGNKCELCYAPNGVVIIRNKKDCLHSWELPAPWERSKGTKIVLTVHHIDGDKQNSHVKNLIALCQRCHLRLDLYKHMMKRKRGKQ